MHITRVYKPVSYSSKGAHQKLGLSTSQKQWVRPTLRELSYPMVGLNMQCFSLLFVELLIFPSYYLPAVIWQQQAVQGQLI